MNALYFVLNFVWLSLVTVLLELQGLVYGTYASYLISKRERRKVWLRREIARLTHLIDQHEQSRDLQH